MVVREFYDFIYQQEWIPVRQFFLNFRCIVDWRQVGVIRRDILQGFILFDVLLDFLANSTLE